MPNWRCPSCLASNLPATRVCRVCTAPQPPPRSYPEVIPGAANHLYPAEEEKVLVSRCTVHGARRHTVQQLRDNQFQTNGFIKDIERRPLEIYRNLAGRRRDKPDFIFLELSETFQNIERHLWRLQQGICCGTYEPGSVVDNTSLPAGIREEIMGDVIDWLRFDIRMLRLQHYPYRASMEFMLRFIKCMEYITFRARTEIEMRHVGVDPDPKKLVHTLDIGEKRVPYYSRYHVGNLLSKLRNRRRERTGRKSLSIGSSVFPPSMTLKDVYNYAGLTPKWPFDESHCDRTTNLPSILNAPEMFLVPSYQPLDAAFFSKIRQVPIFLVGLIDIEFITADGINMSPLTFFDHDLFHVFGDPPERASFDPEPQICQMWHTMKYRLDEITRQMPGVSADIVMGVWDRNVRRLRAVVDNVPEGAHRADLVHAIDILLFTIFHEPIPTDSNRSPPALPDPVSIEHRLRDEQGKLFTETVKRIDEGWFGRVSSETKRMLSDEAQVAVLRAVWELEADPLRDKGLWAYKRRGRATEVFLPPRPVPLPPPG